MEALDPTAYPQYGFFQTDTRWTYISDGAHWDWIAGEYGRTQTQIAALGATLGASDVGALVDVTDYRHVLQWNGAGWNFFDPSDGPGSITGFLVDPSPAVGWHLCDGTAAVPYLKSDGTLGTLNLPNLVGIPAYLKFGTAAGAINAPVAPLLTMASYTPAGIVSQPTFSGYGSGTGNDLANTSVPVGTGAPVVVAADPHSHNYTPAGIVSQPTFAGAPHTLTGINDATGEPQNVILRPWFRQ